MHISSLVSAIRSPSWRWSHTSDCFKRHCVYWNQKTFYFQQKAKTSKNFWYKFICIYFESRLSLANIIICLHSRGLHRIFTITIWIYLLKNKYYKKGCGHFPFFIVVLLALTTIKKESYHILFYNIYLF